MVLCAASCLQFAQHCPFELLLLLNRNSTQPFAISMPSSTQTMNAKRVQQMHTVVATSGAFVPGITTSGSASKSAASSVWLGRASQRAVSSIRHRVGRNTVSPTGSADTRACQVNIRSTCQPTTKQNKSFIRCSPIVEPTKIQVTPAKGLAYLGPQHSQAIAAKLAQPAHATRPPRGNAV